jgi:toxin-antitoxin system PIN domain toxin
MPTLCDVNFLLALCYERHVHHPEAQNWLDQQNELELVLCRNTQLGLLRLLSNPSVMGSAACTLKQAWDVFDTVLSDMRFEFYSEPEGLEEFLRLYTALGRFSPKLWQDAYLAAFARAARLQLVSFDQGFRQFDGLRLILLP